MNKNILYIPIGLLIVGIFPLPIGYYFLVRLIVTIASVMIAWSLYQKNNKSPWMWIFGFIAILFNPLIPIYLNKALWIIIDLTTAGLFFQYSKRA